MQKINIGTEACLNAEALVKQLYFRINNNIKNIYFLLSYNEIQLQELTLTSSTTLGESDE